jgi:hypothetical protein
MPTMSQAAIANKVQRPDILSIDGQVKVLAAGLSAGSSMPAGIPARFRRYFRGMGSRDSDVTAIDQKNLNKLKLDNGIPGKREVEYQFLIDGKGKIKVTLDCLKGGKYSKEITLK